MEKKNEVMGNETMGIEANCSASSSTELSTHHVSMTRQQIFEMMLMTSCVLQFAVEYGNIQTVVVQFYLFPNHNYSSRGNVGICNQ